MRRMRFLYGLACTLIGSALVAAPLVGATHDLRQAIARTVCSAAADNGHDASSSSGAAKACQHACCTFGSSDKLGLPANRPAALTVVRVDKPEQRLVNSPRSAAIECAADPRGPPHRA